MDRAWQHGGMIREQRGCREMVGYRGGGQAAPAA